MDELVKDKEKIVKEQTERRESLVSLVDRLSDDDFEEIQDEYYRKKSVRKSLLCK
jgi:hypothetical protein